MSSPLPQLVDTVGQDLKRRYGQRVHELAIHAAFTCPNRDASKGRGGCTFCNDASFSPNVRRHEPAIDEEIAASRTVIGRRTGARRFLAYFQAYTNSYANVDHLDPVPLTRGL